MQSDDLTWLNEALYLANQAEEQGEVPVGAVIVCENKIIGKGWNQPIKTHDPTAHAEVIALREAAKALNNYRLIESTLYVTLEPCVMCLGAMIHARVKRLVFGAYDPRAGAVVSLFNMLTDSKFNHKLNYTGGLLEKECGDLLRNFFQKRRSYPKSNFECP